MEEDEAVDETLLFDALWSANCHAQLLARPREQRHAFERWLRERAEFRAAATPLTHWCAPFSASQRRARATESCAMFARMLLAALEEWGAEGGALAGARRADAARIAGALALRACDSLDASRALLARALALADARACRGAGWSPLFPYATAAGAAGAVMPTHAPDPWAPVRSTQLLAPRELAELRAWGQLLRIRGDVLRRCGARVPVAQIAALRDAHALLNATQLYNAFQALTPALDAPCPAALQLLALSCAPDAPRCARLQLDVDAATAARHAWDAYLTAALLPPASRGVHDACAAVAAAAQELPRDARLPALERAALWLHSLCGGDGDDEDASRAERAAEARVNALCATCAGDQIAVGAVLLAARTAVTDERYESPLQQQQQQRFALPWAQQCAALTLSLAVLHRAVAASASSACAATWPATPAGVAAAAPAPEQGGWASLPHDLVRRVLHHMLSHADADAAAHFLLRGVCAAWRAAVPGGRPAWRAWCSVALCGRFAKAAHAPGLSRAQLAAHCLLLRHVAAAAALSGTDQLFSQGSRRAVSELSGLCLNAMGFEPLATHTAALAAEADAPALLRMCGRPNRSATFAVMAPPGAHASVAGAWLELRLTLPDYPTAPPGVTLRGRLDDDALPIMAHAQLEEDGTFAWPAHVQHNAEHAYILNHVAHAAALLAQPEEAPVAAAARAAAHGCLTLAAALGAPPGAALGYEYRTARPRNWPTLPQLLLLLLLRQAMTVVLPFPIKADDGDEEAREPSTADGAALRAYVWATAVAPARAALARMLRCGHTLCALATPGAAAAAAAAAAARTPTPLEAAVLAELREWQAYQDHGEHGTAAEPPPSFWPEPAARTRHQSEVNAAEARWACLAGVPPAADDDDAQLGVALGAAAKVDVTLQLRFSSVLEEHGACSAEAHAAMRRAMRAFAPPQRLHGHGTSQAEMEWRLRAALCDSLQPHVLPMRRRALLELARAAAACDDARVPALDLQLLTMVNAAAGTLAAEALLSDAEADADAGGGAGSLAAWVGLQ
jgi:hypothetical protein